MPAAEMIYLVLTRGGKAMRYFPVGAKSAIHVPLAVLEDHFARKPRSRCWWLRLKESKSAVVLDIGFMEIA